MIRADRMNNINFEIIEMAHSFEFAAYKAIAKTKGLFFFGGNQWKPLLLEFFVRKIQPTEPVIANTEMLKKQKKKGATGRACLLSRFHFWFIYRSRPNERLRQLECFFPVAYKRSDRFNGWGHSTGRADTIANCAI